MSKRHRLAVGAAFAAALAASTVAATAETLRLVTNWGPGIYSVARTLQWAEEFNASDAAKAADIQISFVGGPEVTPATEQLTALRSGVFDMLFGAAGYYVGAVPEAYALYGTEITPMQARANGAIDLLDRIYAEKANARVLGWVAAGVGYHLWLKDEPKLTADGMPDLEGLKIRSSGLYKAWLDSMGGASVMIPAPDIYTSLERGIVDGAAWPGLGITDFGFEKFVGYRVDPPVWQFDNLIWVNADKWNGLTDAQRQALADSVRDFEPVAHAHYEGLVKEEMAKTDAAGVKSFMLPENAMTKYIADAQALQWAQIEAKAPENYEALRKVLPPSQ